MSEATMENLSEREQACLEHLRQAQELGVSFAEYCRSFELNAAEWYAVKQALVRKGILPGRARTEGAEPSAGFVPVRIVPSVSSPTVACRLRHPSGWTIECMSLPDAAWLAALMSEGTPA